MNITSEIDRVARAAPRPLHDKTDYENAVKIIDQLAGHNLNADQEDYLDLLSDLVATYEDQHAKPVKCISGMDALRFILSETSTAPDAQRHWDVSKAIRSFQKVKISFGKNCSATDSVQNESCRSLKRCPPP